LGEKMSDNLREKITNFKELIKLEKGKNYKRLVRRRTK
jgi:hypothetical protein